MFYCFPKCFVICDITYINIIKKVFFSCLIKLTQRLRCLLYAFLSMSLFEFKNLFLSSDLYLYLFIVLFMKGAWFARTYRCFIGACH